MMYFRYFLKSEISWSLQNQYLNSLLMYNTFILDAISESFDYTTNHQTPNKLCRAQSCIDMGTNLQRFHSWSCIKRICCTLCTTARNPKICILELRRMQLNAINILFFLKKQQVQNISRNLNTVSNKAYGRNNTISSNIFCN